MLMFILAKTLNPLHTKKLIGQQIITDQLESRGGKEVVNWHRENGFVKGDQVEAVIENPTTIRLLNKTT